MTIEEQEGTERLIIRSNKEKLKNVISGFELDILGEITHATRELVSGKNGYPISENDNEISFVCGFYCNRPDNVFGGTISPGDAVFINEFIKRIRPQTVLEFGVASGFSSAFILCSMRKHGLFDNKGKGLISFDVLERHSISRVVGCVVFENYEDLAQHWTLHTKKTSIDLFLSRNSFDIEYGARILAFVDAGHNHPWPLIDLYVLVSILPPGSWILLQDISLVERLVIDSIRLNCSTNKGRRGVQIAFEHWPGIKTRGLDGCYNMGAVLVPEKKEIIIHALKKALKYPFEKELDQKALEFLRVHFEAAR